MARPASWSARSWPPPWSWPSCPGLGQRRDRQGPRVPQQPRHPGGDIYVNGAKTLSDVTYGTLSDYLEVPKGTYNVQVKVAPSDADPAALEADVRLGSRPTTIAAIGSLTGDGGALQLKVLRDRDTISRHLTSAAGRPRSPDAPAVDVQGQAGRPGSGSSAARVRRGHRLPAPAGLEVPAADRRRRHQHRGQGLRQGPLKGSTSYTAWAVGFLSPTDDYPGFDVFVSVDG